MKKTGLFRILAGALAVTLNDTETSAPIETRGLLNLRDVARQSDGYAHIKVTLDADLVQVVGAEETLLVNTRSNYIIYTNARVLTGFIETIDVLYENAVHTLYALLFFGIFRYCKKTRNVVSLRMMIILFWGMKRCLKR